MSIREIARIVSRRWWLLVLPVALVFAIGFFVAHSLPGKYRSTATILIEAQDVPAEYIKANITTFADQRLQNINQRIMLAPRLLEMIAKLKLYPELAGQATTEELVARMVKDIDFATISAEVKDPRSGRSGQATIAFSVSYVSPSPETAQLVANELSSLYMEENLKARERQSAGTSKFLQSELDELRAELANSEERIASFKQRHFNSLPEHAQLNLRSYDEADAEIKQAEVRLGGLAKQEEQLKAQLAGAPPLASGEALQKLAGRLEELRRTFSDQYPEVLRVRGEMEELERQNRAQGSRAVKPDNPAYLVLESQLQAARSEAAAARRQLSSLVRQRKDFQGRITASSTLEDEYKTLMAERNNLQQKYDDLFKKGMEAKIADGLEKGQLGERFTMIDPPRLPERPFSPNVRAILLVALALGVCCGIGTAAVVEYADQSVRSAEDLQRVLTLPVLVTIPTIVTVADVEAGHRKRALAVTAALVCVALAACFVHFLMQQRVSHSGTFSAKPAWTGGASHAKR